MSNGGKKYKMSKSHKRYKKNRRFYKKTDRISQRKEPDVGTRLIKNMFRGGLQPLHKSVVLRYSETTSLSTTALSTQFGSTIYYNLNSAYKPTGSSAGHQGYLYDQMIALYNKYRVNAVKVEIMWSTPGGSADIACGFSVNSPSSYVSFNGKTLDYITEMNNVQVSYISPSGNTRTVKQSFYLPIHKILGISKTKYNSSQIYEGGSGVSPSTIASLEIGVSSPSASSSEAVICQVVIQQYCIFYDRIFQNQS